MARSLDQLLASLRRAVEERRGQHLTHIVQIAGESYRLKNKRQAGQTRGSATTTSLDTIQVTA